VHRSRDERAWWRLAGVDPITIARRLSRWERGRPNRHYRDRVGFDADAGSWGDAISVSSPMQRFFRSAYRGSNPGLSNTLSAPRG
jgi:hypothetical protein